MKLSANHMHRQVEVETARGRVRNTCATTVEDFRARIAAAEARRDRELADLEAKAEAKHTELSASIAREFLARAKPLISAWVEQPSRSTAAAFADLWRASEARARDELGGELSVWLMAHAVAAPYLARFPAAVNAFADYNGGWGGGGVCTTSTMAELVSGARRAISVASIPALVAALEALENTLGAVAASCASAEVLPEALRRYEACASAATDADRSRALEQVRSGRAVATTASVGGGLLSFLS